MRFTLALLAACLLVVPGVIAEDSIPMHEGCPDDLSTEEHAECHEDQESPGIGAVAAIGAVGALAFLARRRMA